MFEFRPHSKMRRLKTTLKWLEDIFFKRNYDFSRADVELFHFHPQILIILMVQGIFYGQRDSLVRFIWPAMCVSLTLTATGMEMMFIYHGVTADDISLAIECFCYLVMLFSIPGVYYGVLTNKHEILNLLDDMNRDFHHVCSLGPMHRKPFLDNQLLIWQLGLCWFTFTGIVGVLFMLFPVILLHYQSLFATQDEHMIRPLAYPMWLPYDDPYRTPNYEVFLVLEMSFSLIFFQAFCGYIYLLFHFLGHYNTMMDMIILDFKVIFEGLDPAAAKLPKHHSSRIEVQRELNKRVGRIVTWHLSIFKAVSTISSVFGPALVYQVVFSAIAICLMAFQIARKLDEGKFDFLFVLLTIAGCIQLWIPCFLGTLLRNKGFAIGDSCFYCGWNETPLGQLIRAHIVIIIFRSHIPIYIKFTGLPNIQLETYSSILSKSYSYFNMLRQYSK